VLNSSSDNFISDLSKIVDNLKANIFLDCIGSKIVSEIIRKLPFESTVIFYGTLAPEDLGITTPDLLFGRKTLTYFGCPFWLQSESKEQKIELVNEIIEDTFRKSGEKLFESNISKTYAFKDLALALAEYPRYRSEGKLIISMEDDQ